MINQKQNPPSPAPASGQVDRDWKTLKDWINNATREELLDALEKATPMQSTAPQPKASDKEQLNDAVESLMKDSTIFPIFSEETYTQIAKHILSHTATLRATVDDLDKRLTDSRQLVGVLEKVRDTFRDEADAHAKRIVELLERIKELEITELINQTTIHNLIDVTESYKLKLSDAQADINRKEETLNNIANAAAIVESELLSGYDTTGRALLKAELSKLAKQPD